MNAITIRREESGHVIFISMIMVLISLGFTVGYLQFVMAERFLHKKHVAQVQAKLNSYSGLGKFGAPTIKSSFFNSDTTWVIGEDIEAMNGYNYEIECKKVQNTITQNFDLESTSIGVAHFKGFGGQEIPIHDTSRVRYTPQTFADYMYFTNEETPGPVWFGSNVNFRGPDEIEGRVFSNSNITMNSTCPEFVNGENEERSVVETAGHFVLNGCNPETIFRGDHHEGVEPIDWPPFEGHDKVREVANWVYDANEFVSLAGPNPDILLMTEIEFIQEGFIVKQWEYQVPPLVAYTPPDIFSSPTYRNTYWNEFVHQYAKYYPHTFQTDPDTWLPASRAAFTGGGYNNDEDWGHFNYAAYPMPTTINDFFYYEVVNAHEGVIWIEGGSVRVHGTVNGRFTVATSAPTLYRMPHTVNNIHYPQPKIVELKNNIWITGDLKYADSYLNGGVRTGSTNRLGLLSAGHIVVANTAANRNDVVINAAMIAMDASFTIHYWQNTTTAYWGNLAGQSSSGMIKGDGQSLIDPFNPTGPLLPTTGNNDLRGEVHIWGSVTQARRGYLKRNTIGPYDVNPGIGYDKDYHYDYNLRDYPPPAWPENRNSDGSRNMSIAAFGGLK